MIKHNNVEYTIKCTKKCKINVSKLNRLIHRFECRMNRKEPPTTISFTKFLRTRVVVYVAIVYNAKTVKSFLLDILDRYGCNSTSEMTRDLVLNGFVIEFLSTNRIKCAFFVCFKNSALTTPLVRIYIYVHI